MGEYSLSTHKTRPAKTPYNRLNPVAMLIQSNHNDFQFLNLLAHIKSYHYYYYFHQKMLFCTDEKICLLTFHPCLFPQCFRLHFFNFCFQLFAAEVLAQAVYFYGKAERCIACSIFDNNFTFLNSL